MRFEYSDVYIDFEKGEVKCMCLKSKKLCDKKCTPDCVSRDKYKGWRDTMQGDKFGKTRCERYGDK